MSFGQPTDSVRYANYLRIPELLKTQVPLTDEHDELQFIIVHQVYELWFRLILHEVDSVMLLLDPRGARVPDERLREATRLLHRVVRIQDVLLQQLPVMETMLPGDFLRFRDRLKPASGFQSAQFREIEFVMGSKSQALYERCDADPEAMAKLKKRLDDPTLRERFLDAIRSRGFEVSAAELGSELYTKSVLALLPLYKSPSSDPLLTDLCEALLDFDERLVLWRSRHYSMVERVIGGKIGTGYAATGDGYEGIRYLAQTLQKKAFPELWEVRSRLSL